MQKTYIFVILFLTLFVLPVAAQDDIPVHNIENSKVCRYLNEVTYDYYSGDCDESYYADKTVADEQPRPFKVTLPHPADTCAYIYYNIKGEKVDSIRVDEGENEVKLYNLYPGKNYEYSIALGEDTIAGEFRTVGRLRMIGFPTLYNTRDLGGWRTDDGKMIRYGWLYRGIELHCGLHNTADSATVAGLKALGIAAELDMRRTFYPAQYSDMNPNEVPKGSAFGDEVPYTFLNLTSVDAMLSSYGSKFRDGLRFVIDNIRNDRPVYFHCVWGADRTGMLSAIIESILGVSLNDVYIDYCMTSFSTYSGIRSKYSLNTRLFEKIGYNPEGEETLQECCTNYVVKNLGIPMADIDMLREKLIVVDDLPVVEYVPEDVPTRVEVIKNKELRVKNLSYFNLTGQRVNPKSACGIIISNGKKYLPYK